MNFSTALTEKIKNYNRIIARKDNLITIQVKYVYGDCILQLPIVLDVKKREGKKTCLPGEITSLPVTTN